VAKPKDDRVAKLQRGLQMAACVTGQSGMGFYGNTKEVLEIRRLVAEGEAALNPLDVDAWLMKLEKLCAPPGATAR
jgi:hypothetical protein